MRATNAELAAAEEEADHEAEDVEAPRSDDGVVEVVHLEFDQRHAVRALCGVVVVGDRAGAEGAEVFEVEIAGDPTDPRRAGGEVGRLAEDFVKHRGGAAEERERRRAHAIELVGEEVRGRAGGGFVAGELAAGEGEGVEEGHGRGEEERSAGEGVGPTSPAAGRGLF